MQLFFFFFFYFKIYMWALQDILFPGRVRPVKSQQIQTRLEMDALSLRYNLPKCTKSVPTGPEIERAHVMFQQYFQFFFFVLGISTNKRQTEKWWCHLERRHRQWIIEQQPEHYERQPWWFCCYKGTSSDSPLSSVQEAHLHERAHEPLVSVSNDVCKLAQWGNVHLHLCVLEVSPLRYD